MAGRKRIAVFASGFGSNLQALLDFNKKDDLGGDITLVFSNKSKSRALDRARKSNIKAVFLDPAKFDTRDDYDREILKLLKSEKIDLIVLAGYMYLLSSLLVGQFKNKILNIHPALLPSFKGTHGIKDAFDQGVKITGVTVHFVDEKLDHGPIVIQEVLGIGTEDNMQELEEKIHEIEHRIYPRAVRYFCRGELLIEGRKVKILKSRLDRGVR